jgi:broad specificity phosphatase PhoE
MLSYPPFLQRIFLVRHGQTAWSLSGQHTGRTDIPLTAEGETEARKLYERLRTTAFNRVFTSPLQRARQTATFAALSTPVEIEPDLVEWDHGEYEGLRSAEIRAIKPDWNLYQDGCPGGESPAQVLLRADRMIARLRILEDNIAIFSHGHFGCVLAARWIGLEIEQASHFLLDTASISILGYGHQRAAESAIMLWNARPDAAPEP